MKEKKCPFCKTGKLIQTKKKITFQYKGKKTKIEQPGKHCDSCEEGILSGRDIKATEKQLHDFRAQIDGYLSCEEVRAIRIKLGLTQHQAAGLFGGGVNAFSRYERGEVRQTKALDQLLRLLAQHPEYLHDLEKDEAA